MTAHQLAKILMAQEDLPISTHANNHTYDSDRMRGSHGPLRVVLWSSERSKRLIIGNVYQFEGENSTLMASDE